jgi:hypothetical protein
VASACPCGVPLGHLAFIVLGDIGRGEAHVANR